MNKLKLIKKILKISFYVKTGIRKHLKNLDEHKKNWSNTSIPDPKSIEPKITWLGQSSFLIQTGNINIVTDPAFFDLGVLCKRLLPLGVDIKNFPKIDLVLISHNHRDHMNEKSLLELAKHDPAFFVPGGNKKWFVKRNFKNAREFLWDETQQFNDLKLTFLKTKHWSSRNIIDLNKSLWGSWMIEFDNHTIYFGGDTAYDSHFSEIASKYSNIDVAILPIGPTVLRHLIAEEHTNAIEAGQAFLDLNAKHFIPMHWGTYPLAPESFDAPIKQLQSWWKENTKTLKNKTLHIQKCGECCTFCDSSKKPFDRLRANGKQNTPIQLRIDSEEIQK
jgi:L-ascorbate metabolism protein UlaG (beta-lactamase superfamily)